MPATYNLPAYVNAYSEQDVNLYNKLPFYLASMQCKYQQKWDTYNKLWGSIKWQPNMGSIMKGVQAVNTPLGGQQFFPQPITSPALKDVFTALERTEQTQVLHHKFESQLLAFLPSFQDFRTGQVDFQHEDIVRQQSWRNDVFIRSVMFQKAPYVYVVGNTAAAAAISLGNPELIAAPYVPGGTDMTAANVAFMGKNAAWLMLQMASVGSPGLKLTTLDRMVMTLRDDLGAPFFEGTVNTPKDNELIKGKYVFIGSAEAFQMLKWDPNLQNFRDRTENIANDGFNITPFNEITWKTENKPLRIADDGTFPDPEVSTASGDTVPNPPWSACRFEVGFLVAADAYKTITIGPPPKPFSSGSMDMGAFAALQWNGEVRLTRDFLLRYADGTYDTNKYGEFVQLVSYLTMGCLPVRPRNRVPVIYERARPATQQVG